MPLTWNARSILALAAILLPALFLGSPLPTAAQTQANASLAGHFLIASPSMLDPRFDRAVVLMVQHSKDGAFGIVINRPLGERPLASLLEILGEKDAAVAGSVRIFVGGPVQPELGFVIHSTDYDRSGTVHIDRSVAMTSSREIFRDIALNKGPNKSLVAFGYAGWAPGQLEGELARRVW